jgi:predicted MFS family arabinose efflux permease
VSSGGAVARQSYELPFFAVSIVALLAASAVRIWVPSCNATSSADQIQSRLSFDPNVRTIWRLRTIGFVVAIGIGAFEVGLALRGSQDLGMGPRQVALMFTACSLVMFVVQAAVFSPMVAPASTRWFIMPALITMAVALILVPRTTDFTALLAIVAVVAASAGILSPILTYWVSLEGGTSKGAELGKQTAVTSLGQTLGSLVGGSFFASTILQGAPFLISSILLAAAAIACWRLPRRLGHTRARLSGFAPGKNPHVSSSSTNH